MAGFRDAYEAAGYDLANPRIQWSAARADRRVALTVWSDEIDKSREPWIYDLRKNSWRGTWAGKPGHGMRTRHVAEALAAGHTRFDLILCVPEHPTANPRKVKTARHWTQRVGVIDPATFDPSEGTFRMELRPAEA